MGNRITLIIRHVFQTFEERELFETYIAIERAKYGRWANSVVNTEIINNKTILIEVCGQWRCWQQLDGSFIKLIDGKLPGTFQYGWYCDGDVNFYYFSNSINGKFNKYACFYLPKIPTRLLPPFRQLDLTFHIRKNIMFL